MLSYLLWWPLLRGWHSQTAYVHAIMTPYNNCIWLSCILTQHTTVCITIMPEWIDYCSSTHSQTDMYHNSWTRTHIKDCVCFVLKQEVKGVAVGRKASDEVGLLTTLINSMLEVKSVTLARNAKTQHDLVRPKSDNVIVSLGSSNDETTDFETNECGPRKYLRITFASQQNKNSL